MRKLRQALYGNWNIEHKHMLTNRQPRMSWNYYCFVVVFIVIYQPFASVIVTLCKLVKMNPRWPIEHLCHVAWRFEIRNTVCTLPNERDKSISYSMQYLKKTFPSQPFFYLPSTFPFVQSSSKQADLFGRGGGKRTSSLPTRITKWANVRINNMCRFQLKLAWQCRINSINHPTTKKNQQCVCVCARDLQQNQATDIGSSKVWSSAKE